MDENEYFKVIEFIIGFLKKKRKNYRRNFFRRQNKESNVGDLTNS